MPPEGRTADYERLCRSIFEIDAAVRFAGVIGKMGKLEAGGMRKGVTALEQDEDAQRVYLDFALRSAMRHDFDPVFGRVLYAFSEREKIKFATFPIAEETILLVSIERAAPHDTIVEKVRTLVGQLKGK
ncbi:MAG: DUF6659 family protein [Nitrososphaera sp.]